MHTVMPATYQLPKHAAGWGFFFLGNMSSDPTNLNAPVHCESRIMKNIMASAAEAEIGALFNNTQTLIPLRTTLLKMGHVQPLSPIQTGNTTTAGFVSKSIKQHKTKAIDMWFYWLQDQQNLQTIHVYWCPKHHNYGNYLTKHHSMQHHKHIRPFILNSHTTATTPPFDSTIATPTPFASMVERVCRFCPV